FLLANSPFKCAFVTAHLNGPICSNAREHGLSARGNSVNFIDTSDLLFTGRLATARPRNYVIVAEGNRRFQHSDSICEILFCAQNIALALQFVGLTFVTLSTPNIRRT